MKAIILSAGRGSRLLPLTETMPKCLLPVAGTTVLGRQLDVLEAEGVTEAVVVTGFMAALVEDEVAKRTGPMKVTTSYNPFFQVADNLASCWMVRAHMDEDFLLINGDTLFEQALLHDVLQSPANPIQVTVNKKGDYDSDDMKVTLDGTRLTSIGKSLPLDKTDAESIGILRFMGEGRQLYKDKLEQVMRTPEGVRFWFLKAIDAIAQNTGQVQTYDITGRDWQELDTMEDYDALKRIFGEG